MEINLLLVKLKCQLSCAYRFGDRGIWVLSDCRTGPFLRSVKKALLSVTIPPALLSLPFETVLSAQWVAFSWALYVVRSKGALTTPPTDSEWKGASSRQEEGTSSLTLMLLCLSCLLTPDTSWDNTGTGAKPVTSTYRIRAESCIDPLLTNLCSVLDAFGFLYFFLVSHVLGPIFLLLKLIFVTSEEGREEI